MTETIRWDRDDDGIVVLTLDDPGRPANTMNPAYVSSMDTVLDRLEREREQITGVVVTSAKKTFFAGGDLDSLGSLRPEQAAELTASTAHMKRQLRRLETLGRPVVAALNGSALGGGLEIALACHHRIAVDDPRLELGLPEVTLGLMPGCGGVVRAVRLLGITKALTEVLLRGQRHRPAAALALGLVDELIDAPADLLARARAWIAANPDAVQPWDRPGYRVPGGTPASPAFATNLPAFPANLRKQLKGAPYPAPRNILATAVEGTQVDLDTAFAIEGRYFVEVATGQVARNMIGAFFFDLRAAQSRGQARSGSEERSDEAGPNQPPGQQRAERARLAGPRGTADRPPVESVGVLGAGMMGAAIAYVCARAGMRVVLKDTTAEAAGRGRDYSVKLLDKAVHRGQLSAGERDGILDRIRPTADPADLAGVGLVIEAVFEDPAVKHQVFAEIEDVVAADALLASNTSTLPITSLADGVRRQADFIGLHFFSPVDKMPLVEVICGAKTSDESVDRALGVVRQLRKTPIVVNDSRGFFTSRVIGTFTNEGIALLGEGVEPASVEQASSQAGYPSPVLALMDELTLTLPRKIRQESAAAGASWVPHPADAIVDRMIDEFGRPGRSSGAGFYEYENGKRIRLWPGLREHFTRPEVDPPFQDLIERMLFIEAIEAVKCLDEGVITSVADANIGSILGIGYPGWTGGVLRYVNQYRGGLPGFVTRARELADRYGDRFTPPPLLLAKSERGERFE